MPIEDYFRPPDIPGNFPLLRLVAARKDAGEQPVFELFRPREAFGFRKAMIVIHFLRDGQEIDSKDDGWDDDLNAGLVQLGVKSANPDEEKDRFVLGLRAALRTPEKRYGDAYFSMVLLQYILSTEFRNHEEVAAVLRHVSKARPDENGRYDDCWKMIDAAVKGRAAELLHNLRYEMPMAWDIVAGALARYVDERFSITNRKLLGLL